MTGSAILIAALITAPAVRYDVRARADRPGRITATADITIVNPLADSLHAVRLLLHPNAVADPAGDFARDLRRAGRFDLALAGAGGGYTELTDLGTGLALPADSSALTLPLALAPGETALLSIGWTLQLGPPFAEWGHRNRELLLAHWYPQVAALAEPATGYHRFGHTPAEPADFNVSLDIPAGTAVASNGTPADTIVTRMDDLLRWPASARPGRQAETDQWRFTATAVSDFVAVAGPAYSLSTDTACGVRVRVFSRSPARLDWLDAARTVAAMVRAYTILYGPPPRDELTIVQASGLAPADAGYPGLIIVSQQPIPATRLFEANLARLVALQWFCGPNSADEISPPWTAQGPAAHAAMRYMQLRHGRTDLLDQPLLERLLAGLSTEYFHRLYAYVAETNRLLRPPDSIAACRDEFEFNAAQISHAGLWYRRLENRLGPARFDSIVRANPGRPLAPALFADSAPAAGLWRNGESTTRIRPIFSLPDFEQYQLYYGPYAWYDNYHGFQLAGWAMGRRFIDTGPLRGGHMWTFSETYSTKIDDWHSSLWYQTTAGCISPRTRIILRGDYSYVAAEARAGIQQELGRVFGRPNALAELTYRLFVLNDIKFRDSRAWDSSRIAEVRGQLTHNWDSPRAAAAGRAFASLGSTKLGSEYDYWKLWFEETFTLRLGPRQAVRLRAFAGTIQGVIPNQEQYYLSGGLGTTIDEPVSWGYKGMSSGQEHWHYDADLNLRGYAGEYLHGTTGWALNLYLQPIPQVQPFLDVGWLDNPDRRGILADAGLRLQLGPLYADFPVWTSQPDASGRRLAFRWMLGLKLSGLTGS